MEMDLGLDGTLVELFVEHSRHAQAKGESEHAFSSHLSFLQKNLHKKFIYSHGGDSIRQKSGTEV